MESDGDAALTGAQNGLGGAPATVRNKLLQELRALRNGPGATAPRVAVQPTLLSLGRMWRQAGRTPADGDSKAARHLLEVCIGELHSRERMLLLAQFGFTHHQRSREQRETAYLEEAQDAGDPGSASSFDRWSKVGLEQVAHEILERVATGDHVDERPSFGGGPMASEPLIVEGRFDRYRFRAGQVLHDLVCERVVKCLAPGDHVYLAHHVYYSDRSEGPSRLNPNSAVGW